MTENKKPVDNKFNLLLEKILGGTYYTEIKGFKGTFQKILRILFGSVKKFLSDEGLLRAASISYSLILSLVPMMVVGLLVTAKLVEKEKYFLFAREFIRKNSIPIDPEPYFNIINELLNNANAVTGIGFLMLLFSATSVLRNFDAAINTIWKVKKGRPLVQNISAFLLVLIFGPVLITIGFSMGQNVVRIAAPPAITEFNHGKNYPVAVGEKNLFLKYQDKKWQPENILSKIDFETYKETILFKSATNTIITGDEKISLLPKIYQPSKNDIKLKSFNSYNVSGDQSWIVTDNGCILMSNNSEKTWNIQCYQLEDTKLLFGLKFNKIKMIDNSKGFIIGNKGLLLKTNDGGKNWQPAFDKNINSDLVDLLAIDKENFLLIGDKFSIFKSSDEGNSWDIVQVEKPGIHDKADLTAIRKLYNNIWITGDYGTLLLSRDNGNSWELQNPGITPNEYNDIFFKNEKTGILIGEKGFIRLTQDGGKTWSPVKPDTDENLNKIFFFSEINSTFISGNESVILESQNGDLGNFVVAQDSPAARSVLFAFGSFGLPFIFIGIIFFVVYKILPYTQVINKAAFYGAAVTSLLWVLFLLGFKLYVSSFSKGTFAIYGTLAAIPLLLLLVYTSTSIMLYGAEVSFFVQNPGLLRIGKNALKIDDDKRQVWYGLKMLHTLFSNFDKGKGSTSESELVRICHNDFLEFNTVIEKFFDHGIIEKTEKKKYTPVVSPSTILMKDLIGDLDPVEYNVPDTDIDADFKSRVDKYFDLIKKSKAEILGSLSFADFYKSAKPFE